MSRTRTRSVISAILFAFIALSVFAFQPILESTTALAAESPYYTTHPAQIVVRGHEKFNLVAGSGNSTNYLTKDGEPDWRSDLDGSYDAAYRGGPPFLEGADLVLFKSEKWENRTEGSSFLRTRKVDWDNAKVLGSAITAERFSLKLDCRLIACVWTWAPDENLKQFQVESRVASADRTYEWSLNWTRLANEDSNYLSTGTDIKILSLDKSKAYIPAPGDQKKAVFNNSADGSKIDLTTTFEGYTAESLAEFWEFDMRMPAEAVLISPSGTITNIVLRNPNEARTFWNVSASLHLFQEGALLQNFPQYVDNWEDTLVQCPSAVPKYGAKGTPDLVESTIAYPSLPIDTECDLLVRIIVNDGLAGIMDTLPTSVGEAMDQLFKGVDVEYLTGATTIKLNQAGDFYIGGVLKGNRESDLVPIILIQETLTAPALLDGLFGDALKDALGAMLGFVNATMDVANEWIDSVIDWGSNINDPALEAVWTNIRNVTLSLLTLAILIIAFANLLNIQPQTFGATVIIPKLITTIVFVYFSYFFIQFILGMATALDKLLIAEGASSASSAFETDAFNTLLSSGSADKIIEGTAGDAAAGYGYVIILFILGLAVVVAMVWICILLVIRIAMIFFLVALAPFAFMMDIFPFTSFLSKMWWAQFWKWAFMGPAVLFCLFIANQFLNIGFATAAAGDLSDVTDNKAWLWLILYAVMLYAAAMIPMQLGGKIMGAWSGLVKKTGKGAWNKTPVPDYLAARKSNIDRRKSKRARDRAAWVNKQGSKGGLRGVIAGSGWRKDAGLAQSIENETLDEMAKDMASDKSGLKDVINKSGRGSLEEKAAIRKAALTGKLDAGNERTREAIKRYADKTSADYIPEFEKTLAKENPDFFAEAAIKAMAAGGTDAPFLTDQAKIGMEKLKPEDYRGNHWRLAARTGGMAHFGADSAGTKSVLENASPGSKKEFAVQMSAYLNSAPAGSHNLTIDQVADIHAIARGVIDTAHTDGNT